MGIAVLVLFYGSAIFCLIAIAVMMVKYARAPLHLHWEFYRGSSVYELPDWWTKTHRDLGGKIKSAVIDILFLREYYHRNRAFWYVLFIFHAGLYLLVFWHIWLFASAATIDIENAPMWGIVWGHVATGLVFIGAVGILIRRITDEDLRVFYPPIHYIKWVFVIIALAGGFYAVFFYFGGNTAAVLEYVKHQLAFELESKINAPVATSIHLLVVVPWLIYLPFSHMMKVFLKYYHQLRWDDKANVRGSDVEKQIKELLNKPVSWAAPHIQSGKKWAEVATEMPGEKSGVETK